MKDRTGIFLLELLTYPISTYLTLISCHCIVIQLYAKGCHITEYLRGTAPLSCRGVSGR